MKGFIMFSIYCTQNLNEMHSGRNCPTKRESIEGALSYLFGGDDFERETVDSVNDSSLEQQELFINDYDLVVFEHGNKDDFFGSKKILLAYPLNMVYSIYS